MTKDTYSFPWQWPLSGNVTQAINPWQWMNHGLAQAGFINISVAAAGNPSAEKHIVENVASYGRQLGILMNVIDVLLEKTDTSGLSDAQQQLLDQYHALCIGVAASKLANGSLLDEQEQASLKKHLAKAPQQVNEHSAWEALLRTLEQQ